MTALVTILWVAVIWRATPIRQERWKRALWVAFAALAVALTAELAPVSRFLDQTGGVTDLGTLIKHLAGIVACAALLDWVIALNSPTTPPVPARRVAVRHAIALAAMAAMTVLFFQIDRRETTNFAETQAGSGIATAYLLTFEVYLGVAMGIATWMFLTVLRDPKTPRGLLATGVWTLAAGTSLGVVYAALRSEVLTDQLVGGHGPGGDRTAMSATDAIQAAAILLIIVGTFVPPVARAKAALADYRALYRLHPLWWDLTAATPKIVLGSRRSRTQDLLTVRDRRSRLIRRTVEIRDSALLLRGLVDEGHYASARGRLADSGLSGEQLEAACEAMWLRASLDAKSASRKPVGSARNPAPHPSLDLAEEVRWLCKVANAYRDPAVRTTATRLVLEPK
ncbi:MAB_1171c family putative transporter [Catenulispora rubra]|uniref:MAB_1171c family putative transporter n=1 Tax=Catenulispora rubra TaxID=280293 RepID=UPI0018925F9A|nr:MAB_1171c family putative transporter [Catenulispora rubra]